MGCSDDIEALSYSLSVMTWFCSKQDVKSVRDDMTTVAYNCDGMDKPTVGSSVPFNIGKTRCQDRRDLQASCPFWSARGDRYF
jgi:hypothetical protein